MRLFSCLAVALACGLTRPVLATEQPNIVVILADDQGWGDLGVNGNSNLATPNIDSLAAAGPRGSATESPPIIDDATGDTFTSANGASSRSFRRQAKKDDRGMPVRRQNANAGNPLACCC